jgi:hypothetical protein
VILLFNAGARHTPAVVRENSLKIENDPFETFHPPQRELLGSGPFLLFATTAALPVAECVAARIPSIISSRLSLLSAIFLQSHRVEAFLSATASG